MYIVIGYLTGTLETLDSSISIGAMCIQLMAIALIIAMWYINGTALNDYADYEIDLINVKADKDRPLLTGAATKRELLYVATFSACVALLTAGLLSWLHSLLVLALLLLNMAYSLPPIQISRRGGAAPLLLPLGYVTLPFLLGYLLHMDSITQLAAILFFALYAQFIGRIILKDYRDVKGDRTHGKMTFLLRHGNDAVCLIAGTAVLVSAGLLVFAQKYVPTLVFCIITLSVFAVTILYHLSKTDRWEDQKPLLAAFGRAMTGVTASIIISLMSALLGLSSLRNTAIALFIVTVYLWSAQEAFDYNRERMARKNSSEHV